jgi:plastocyanin
MIKNLCVGLAVVALAACGGGGGDSNGPPPPPVGNTPVPTGGITVQNNSYSPSAKTVAPGTTVEWAWNSCVGGYDGETCIAHSVTFDDGPSSSLQDKGSFSRTFAAAGTYDYHCSSHGASMSGRITVQ